MRGDWRIDVGVAALVVFIAVGFTIIAVWLYLT